MIILMQVNAGSPLVSRMSSDRFGLSPSETSDKSDEQAARPLLSCTPIAVISFSFSSTLPKAKACQFCRRLELRVNQSLNILNPLYDEVF